MNVILLLLAAGGTLVGAMAFESTIARWVWVIAWGGATAVCLWLTIKNYSAPPTAAEIARELKGGDAYCYFYADLSSPRDTDGGFAIVFQNSGQIQIPWVSWWFYPPEVDGQYYADAYKNSPYKYLSGGRDCPANSVIFYKPTIKPGKYGIDFTGSTGSWKEVLTITESENEITQTVLVTRDGEPLVNKMWHIEKAQ